MAEQKAEGEAAPPKSKKMLIIIIAAVLVLAIAGGAAVMLMGGKKKHKDEEEAAHEEHKTVMVAFEEKFTVNLQSDDGANHFMQVPKMELEVSDATVAKQVEEKKTKIMDRISSTLRGKNMKQMLEPGSDLKLKQELKAEINKVLEKGKGVEEVILPQSFIVQ